MRLLGLDFDDIDANEAARRIATRNEASPFSYVVTPNADHLVRLSRTPSLRQAYDGAWMRLLDSRVVARAQRLLGRPAPAVATGSDLTAILIARHLRPGERVTIIGVRAGDLGRLVANCGLAAPAHLDPPMGFDADPTAFAEAVAFVVAHPARFIFLATGSPRQERLAAAIAATGAARGTALCIGASLDFLSGASRRAPAWMQNRGLEWLHRLASDPRRLARRYLLDGPRVFGLLARDRFSGRAGPAPRDEPGP